MHLRRFRHTSRESDSDNQVSLRKLICAYWRLFRKFLRSRAPNPGSPSSHPSPVKPPDPEFGKLASQPDPARITPFVGTQSLESTSLRSSTETSKRSSLTTITTTTTSRCRPLEPLRRSFTTNDDPLTSFLSETNFLADVVEPCYRYTSYVYDKEDLTLPPSSTPPRTSFERPSIDLIDMDIMDSPISLWARESPTFGEFGDQDPVPSPGRYRSSTYGAMFSQYSIMTLPVYKEQEDDRASVASRAPTYRSHRSTRIPRISLRSSRPPLPLPPAPPFLLVSPSSPCPTKS